MSLETSGQGAVQLKLDKSITQHGSTGLLGTNEKRAIPILRLFPYMYSQQTRSHEVVENTP